jgi:prepilin-type N-terminal cleavage/methylation domain-containing protein
MNKKNNRKGFTTVELVIVIAVIAILATALIPTFGGLINSANDTKYMSEAKQAFNDYMLADAAKASSGTYYIKTTGNTYYEVVNGKLSTTKEATNPTVTCQTTILVVDNTGKYTETTGAHNYGQNSADCDKCDVEAAHAHCSNCGKSNANG